jgi:hypothetical protein
MRGESLIETGVDDHCSCTIYTRESASVGPPGTARTAPKLTQQLSLLDQLAQDDDKKFGQRIAQDAGSGRGPEKMRSRLAEQLVLQYQHPREFAPGASICKRGGNGIRRAPRRSMSLLQVCQKAMRPPSANRVYGCQEANVKGWRLHVPY